MSKIKIKNFGPIQAGFKEDLPDGSTNEWLPLKKVTMFIGNQGSGKSTVAKLTATFLWLEKALVRGDLKAPVAFKDFIELIKYHRLEHYLQNDSQLEYEGEAFHLKWNPVKKYV